MEIYTVSFFGHRELHRPLVARERLEHVVRNIIKTKIYVEFLVGCEGEFDLLTASVIHRVTKECDYGNSSLILVLPYIKAAYKDNDQHFINYYDEIEICTKASNAHFKSAIQIRNRNLIDRSNLVICYLEHNNGGAYNAIQYAKQKRIEILNIAHQDFK